MTWKYLTLIAILLAMLGYLLFLLVSWLVNRVRAPKVESGQTGSDSIPTSAKTRATDPTASDSEKLLDEEAEQEAATPLSRKRAEAGMTPMSSHEMTLEDEEEATQRSVPLQQRIFAHLVRLDKAMGEQCLQEDRLKLPATLDIPNVVNQIGRAHV